MAPDPNTGYVIERSPNGNSGWNQIVRLPGLTTSYTETNLTEGTHYWYRIRSSNAIGDSSNSSPVEATTDYSIPTIISPASAEATNVTGRTVDLHVLGSLPSDESKLRYTWSVSAGPLEAGVGFLKLGTNFGDNGTNSAKNVTAYFSEPGDYTLLVTITNGTQSATSSVSVTVQQTLADIVPLSGIPNLYVSDGADVDWADVQFWAEGYDQFGEILTVQPEFSWSLAPGVTGSITSDGFYTYDDTSAKAPVDVLVSASGLSEAYVYQPNHFQYTLKGDYTAAGVGLEGSTSGTITISGIPSNATVEAAYLYWCYYAVEEEPGLETITFDGNSLTGTKLWTHNDYFFNLDEDNEFCDEVEDTIKHGIPGFVPYGYGFAYRSNVTQYVRGNHSYLLSELVSSGTATAQGASLVVIYSDESAGTKTIMIDDATNEGWVDLGDNNQFEGNFHATGPVSAKVTYIVGGRFGHGSTTFGLHQDPNPIVWLDTLSGSDGPNWDTDTYDVSAAVDEGDEYVRTDIYAPDSDLTWVATIFSVSNPHIDIDIDSDNDDADDEPDRSKAEEAIEAKAALRERS
jgi:hypothetical protein